MSFDVRAYRKGLGCFPTGVTVVTTLAKDNSPLGVTVSSFTSLSLAPPLVLFCLDTNNGYLGSFGTSGHFAVNVLASDQQAISVRFAGGAGDRWQGLPYVTWNSGSPILPGCLANFDCTTVDVREGGDHQIFIGHVDRFAHATTGRPLIHFRGAYAGLDPSAS